MAKAKTKPVLVTTEFRGVFFGWLEKYDKDERRVTLSKIRNVIYWGGNKGFLGLAAHGPEKGSRMGAEAPVAELHQITSITDCTSEAVKRFAEFK